MKKGKLVAAQVFVLIESTVIKLSLNNVVKQLCNIAGVSRSGYYSYLKSKNNRKSREMQDEILKNNILKAFNYRGYKKGSRSIKMILKEKFNITYSRKRIAKATKEHTVVPNLLNRNFKQEVPGKVLITYITYLPYSNSNMAYLSTIKDGSTNEILAYNLSDRITLDIATNTIHKLIENPNVKLAKDAFIHSDQGSHYTSPTFQKLLKSKKFGQSMSIRGNCWDNAPQESFFGHMKDEINYKSCSTLEELQLIIDDYIDYYNNDRCQWNLKKLTPVQYRNQLLNS